MATPKKKRTRPSARKNTVTKSPRPTKKAPSKKALDAKRRLTQQTKTIAKPVRPRRLKLGTYQSFRLQKRIKRTYPLPNVWQLSKRSVLLLWRHRRLFFYITLIYAVLNLVLVKGFSSGTDVASLKSQLSQLFTGHFGSLASSLTVFVVLVGSAGNGSSSTAGAYQFFLVLLASLAIIWALRQVLAGITIRARDAYYRGMYPLIPLILVLLVIGLQLIPLAIGGGLYNLVITNGIAVLAVEKLLWGLLCGLLVLLSLYLLSSSIFAIYIVALPDMTPIKALRSARELVRHRRWTLLRKILFLPLILLVVAAIIMLPIIIFASFLAQWLFFILTTVAVALVHSYLYLLYRELLND